jgi:hypothetical protein
MKDFNSGLICNERSAWRLESRALPPDWARGGTRCLGEFFGTGHPWAGAAIKASTPTNRAWPVFVAIQLHFRDVFVRPGQPVLPQRTAPGQIRFAVAALFRARALRGISKSVTGHPVWVREGKQKSEDNRKSLRSPFTTLSIQPRKCHLGRLQEPATLLVLAQGYHGIYHAGPPGWNDRGRECHNC